MRGARDVYSKTASVLILVGLATLSSAVLLTPATWDRSLRWAVAFSLLQVIATFFCALYLLGRRARARFQESIQEQIRPAIEQRVMALALSGEPWSTTVPKHGVARQVLEECIAHALNGLRDSGRDRIAQFAIEHGFAAQWLQATSSSVLNERKRAISLLGLLSQEEANPFSQVAVLERLAVKDAQAVIRAEAARALLASGETAIIDRVFRQLLQEPLLVRALLTSDLKRHARFLIANTIPSILAANSIADTGSCLKILLVWTLALPGLASRPLLDRYREEPLLPLVLALLPYLSVGPGIEEDLITAMASHDREVRCAAARASGQLKLEGLIPALADSLDQGMELALASATALSKLGADGLHHLELAVRGSNRRAAAVAMEALESSAVGTQ